MAEGNLFDPYEYVAVIAPGAVVSIGLFAAAPDLKTIVGDDVSLGEFGVFLILAYVVGHVVQAFGNAWEFLFWRCLGRPTDAVLSVRQTLITPEQALALQRRASAIEGQPLEFGQLDREQWRRIVPRLYQHLNAAKASGRVDAFNRAYGLLRGMSVAFVFLTAWLALQRFDWPWIALAAVFATALTLRMLRFSEHYARALFLGCVDQGAAIDTNARLPAETR